MYDKNKNKIRKISSTKFSLFNIIRNTCIMKIFINMYGHWIYNYLYNQRLSQLTL